MLFLSLISANAFCTASETSGNPKERDVNNSLIWGKEGKKKSEENDSIIHCYTVLLIRIFHRCQMMRKADTAPQVSGDLGSPCCAQLPGSLPQLHLSRQRGSARAFVGHNSTSSPPGDRMMKSDEMGIGIFQPARDFIRMTILDIQCLKHWGVG